MLTAKGLDTRDALADLDGLIGVMARLDFRSAKIKTIQMHLKLARDQLEKYLKEN